MSEEKTLACHPETVAIKNPAQVTPGKVVVTGQGSGKQLHGAAIAAEPFGAAHLVMNVSAKCKNKSRPWPLRILSQQ